MRRARAEGRLEGDHRRTNLGSVVNSMEENDPKPSEAAEGPRQPESSPSGGSGDADTGRRRNLMLPAVLQAPGNHQHPHRVTNFFIDNILRPEFGRRKDAGTCCAGAGGGRIGSGEGGASGADGGGGAGGADQLLGSGREPRQSAPCAPSAGGPLPVGGGGGGGDSPGEGESGSKALSLHGGAKKGGDPGGPLDGLKARSLGSGDLSLSSDSDSSQAGANLGAQPMLWPAWVYCTRYSDRPSSGEPAGRQGGAGAGTDREEEDTKTSPSPTHTKTHTERHCVRLSLTPASARRRGVPMELPRGYRLLRRAGATGPARSLCCLPEASPHSRWPLPRLELLWWERGWLEDRSVLRPFQLSLDPGPTRSPPADRDAFRDPEVPDTAREGSAQLRLFPGPPAWAAEGACGDPEREGRTSEAPFALRPVSRLVLFVEPAAAGECSPRLAFIPEEGPALPPPRKGPSS